MVAHWIDRALRNYQKEEVLSQIKQEVLQLMENYPYLEDQKIDIQDLLAELEKIEEIEAIAIGGSRAGLYSDAS